MKKIGSGVRAHVVHRMGNRERTRARASRGRMDLILENNPLSLSSRKASFSQRGKILQRIYLYTYTTSGVTQRGVRLFFFFYPTLPAQPDTKTKTPLDFPLLVARIPAIFKSSLWLFKFQGKKDL